MLDHAHHQLHDDKNDIAPPAYAVAGRSECRSAARRPTATIGQTAAHRPLRCPRCDSEAAYRWGKSKAGVPRRRCRDCGKGYSLREDALMTRLRQPGKFAVVLHNMLHEIPASCRHLAERLAVDKTTVWHWRQKICRSLLDPERSLPIHLIDAPAEPLRESRKGSREWVDHQRSPMPRPPPNRPRWVDVDRQRLPLPLPLAAHQLRVLIGVARHGCAPVIVPLACPSAASTLCGDHEKTGTAAAPDDRASSATGTGDHQRGMSRPRPGSGTTKALCPVGLQHILHPPSPASGAAPTTAGQVLRRLGLALPSCLDAAFTGFLRPFAGPAAKHLEGYAAWFVARLEGSDETRIARAETLLKA